MGSIIFHYIFNTFSGSVGQSKIMMIAQFIACVFLYLTVSKKIKIKFLDELEEENYL